MSPNGSIGHLRLYGSKIQGPSYLNQISSSDDDPYTDTGKQICKGVELFTKAVGKPDVIVFQSMLWDIMLSKQGVSDEIILAPYRQNILDRIEDIKNCMDSDTLVFLLTVPWHQRSETLVSLMNLIVKNIAADLGMLVIDFDIFVWGWGKHTPENEKLIFRDTQHPASHYTSLFGLHILQMIARMRADLNLHRTVDSQENLNQ